MRASHFVANRVAASELDRLAECIVLETERQAAFGVTNFGVVLLDCFLYPGTLADFLEPAAVGIHVNNNNNNNNSDDDEELPVKNGASSSDVGKKSSSSASAWPSPAMLVSVSGIADQLNRRGLPQVKVAAKRTVQLYETDDTTGKIKDKLGTFPYVVLLVDNSPPPEGASSDDLATFDASLAS